MLSLIGLFMGSQSFAGDGERWQVLRGQWKVSGTTARAPRQRARQRRRIRPAIVAFMYLFIFVFTVTLYF